MATPNISQITKMLQEPQSVTDADVESIASLIQSYPYFTPGHYFEAARKQRQEPFSPGMMNNMHLYMGNWLQFHQYMSTAAGNIVVEQPVQAIPISSVESVTEEPAPVAESMAAPLTVAIAEEKIIQHKDAEIVAEEIETMEEQPLIQPIYTEDYFLHQGVEVSNEIPEAPEMSAEEEKEKALMRVMSFAEWLTYFKTKSEKAREEEQDKKALKTMWQKEKLAAALEEENDEIPEDVFEMAVNSITQEEDLASESLAEIHVKQGKYDKAIDMYRKLSLRNPQKKVYFARRIEEILKEKQS
jgi:tetratricopeptide (TPR) repeat protein